MNSQELRSRYRQLNESFPTVLVYHIGTGAGFFAEYSAMLNAMLYCLTHRLQFRLYSDDANFGIGKGWTDFFEPFCPEVHEAFHARYNRSAVPSLRELRRRNPHSGRFALLKWKLKSEVSQMAGRVMAWAVYRRNVLLSHNVRFSPAGTFRIPELGFEWDYCQAFARMAEITWLLNDSVAGECRALLKSLPLPEVYAGCQLRGGDKITETSLLSPSHFVGLVRRHAPGHPVFVLADDYRLFRKLQTEAPDVRWLTLCQPEEQGYVNSSFTRSDVSVKRRQMVRFLASMQALMRARPFIGSITTGPSLFLLKVQYPHGVPADCRLEDFSRLCVFPIAERGRFSTNYTQEQTHSE